MPLFGSEITTLGLSELRGSPLDNPAIPINSPAIWEWLVGGETTVSGEQVNEANALQTTTVFACVTLLASMASSLPLRLMERTNGGHQEALNSDLHYLLAYEPNPEMTATTFIETLVGCLAQTGNCYAQIERNSMGQAVALWPLHPLKTEPVRLPNGKLAYKTSDGEAPGSYRIVQAVDIIHVPLYSMDGRKGISPIMMARQSIGLAKATEKFGARFFGNGSRPGGLIFNKGPKPDPKTQKEMRESWQEQAGGTNQGKMQFLWSGDWSYQQLGLSPEESQFLATRGYQRADIAALWKISPHLVGDTSRLSGTNSEQLMLQFLTITLRPYLGKLEAEFVRKLCPTQGRKAGKYFVEFDVSELLRTDLKSQMDAYATGRQWGWFSANKVLQKLGENPGGPELDVYLVPVNMQNAARLLDTESVQDQPIGGEAAPTQAERNLLGVYTRSYISLYKDAFGRLIKRSRRDYETISALFRPVLRAIADTAVTETGWDVGGQSDPTDNTINDVIRAMERRAAKWPKTTTASKQDANCMAEFLRAVRSIHITTSREIAAAKADAQLTPDIDWNDDAQDTA